MKRNILTILVVLLTCSVSFAQPQQGVVKTRGRMVNGKVEKGKLLDGATITLNFGNPLVSGQDGAFSFNVPSGKSYSLVTAKKQGYTLADPEYTRRSFRYSASNPFYVVLEDEAQRQADINAATRKVRRTLTAQLQAREDEIEALKEQNRITEQEYQAKLKELYDNQSQSEKLVKEMAERYVSTDYDQLDEFNQKVQQYIEEGELQKADSMIRSKGNMEQRVAEYHNVVAANKKEREQLEQSESGAARTYEDLSQDLLRRSEIFLQAFQQDSALYCLKMRADLDTTNVYAAGDYASLCLDQRKFTDCEKYYLICLRLSINDGKLSDIAVVQQNLSILYRELHNYERSEMFGRLALKNDEQLFRNNPDAYRKKLADSQFNLGNLYSTIRDYANSEMCYLSALENMEILFNRNPDAYRIDLAKTQHNLGVLYIALHDYVNSEKYLKLALENKEQLCRQDSDVHRADLASTQGGLGILYSKLHDYANSEKYYKLALENFKQLFSQNPDSYRADLACTQNNLGILYSDLNDYANSVKYYILALVYREQLFRQNQDAYRADLANTQYNLGFLYYKFRYFTKGEKYFKLALENREILFSQDPDLYRKELAGTMTLLACCYSYTERYDESIATMDKVISIQPNNIYSYITKGELLLRQGRNEEALAMWKKVLELNPDFLTDTPNGTNLSNGLRKLGLIK